MTEIFVLSICLTTPSNACLKTAEAYYQYSGLNKVVNDYSQKHKELTFVFSVMGVMNEQRLSFPLYKNIIYKYNHKEKLTELMYEYGF